MFSFVAAFSWGDPRPISRSFAFTTTSGAYELLVRGSFHSLAHNSYQFPRQLCKKIRARYLPPGKLAFPGNLHRPLGLAKLAALEVASWHLPDSLDSPSWQDWKLAYPLHSLSWQHWELASPLVFTESAPAYFPGGRKANSPSLVDPETSVSPGCLVSYAPVFVTKRSELRQGPGPD